MDHYHIWCDLLPDVRDLEFVEAVEAYLSRLKTDGLLEGFHITRRKLGLAPPELGEFHIVVHTRDMAQLEQAFQGVARRSGTVESLHQAVNSRICNGRFALYRDFPDPVRERGEERF